MEFFFKNGAFIIETGVITAVLSLVSVIIGAILNMICKNIERKITKKNYVSKVRFDKEFEIYSQLNKDKMLTINASFEVFDLLKGYIEEKGRGDIKSDMVEAEYKTFVNVYNKSNFNNRTSAAFIEKCIYEEFNGYYMKQKKQIVDISKYIYTNDSEAEISGPILGDFAKEIVAFFSNKPEKAKIFDEISKRQTELSKQSDSINDLIRNYFNNLEAKG